MWGWDFTDFYLRSILKTNVSLPLQNNATTPTEIHWSLQMLKEICGEAKGLNTFGWHCSLETNGKRQRFNIFGGHSISSFRHKQNETNIQFEKKGRKINVKFATLGANTSHTIVSWYWSFNQVEIYTDSKQAVVRYHNTFICQRKCQKTREMEMWKEVCSPQVYGCKVEETPDWMPRRRSLKASLSQLAPSALSFRLELGSSPCCLF